MKTSKNKTNSFNKNKLTDKFKAWYFKPKKKFRNTNFYLMLFSLMIAITLLIIVFTQNDIKQQLSNYPWFWVVFTVLILVFFYNVIRWMINLKKQKQKTDSKNGLKIDSYKSWQQKVYEAEVRVSKKQHFGSDKEKSKWWKR